MNTWKTNEDCYTCGQQNETSCILRIKYFRSNFYSHNLNYRFSVKKIQNPVDTNIYSVIKKKT